MRKKYHYPKYAMVMIMILFLGFSCSTIPTLRMKYTLPPSDSDNLRGKEISLVFEDARGDNRILKGGAIDDFEPFSGNVALSLARDNEKSIPIGLFDPRSLFMEAFTRRFEDIGVQVTTEEGRAPVVLIIVLKEFSMDLVERKWIVKMGYEAVVKSSGRITYRNDIHGEGERLKLIGTEQAETLISEIFTDVINRLDLERVYNPDL